jgi:hypothetical protein
MRHAFRNGRTKLQFWIIRAWTNTFHKLFWSCAFIYSNQSRKQPLGSEDLRQSDLQIRHRIKRKRQKMKTNLILHFPAFRNGKDSLKITWVSAWESADIFHAQTFPERWCAKGP